ncbi:50S ribosomal protein L16-like [Hydractinia symbiolongicarpus]|uniref:50S ribosomal protein L16-like n=1 Tax=Hydractinia symbiolongicarpus TaxID=13093 RepID=UPI00254F9D28|nr:50S ribosomal protein L16-like [Hydractinia symbiolongicarpus]
MWERGRHLSAAVDRRYCFSLDDLKLSLQIYPLFNTGTRMGKGKGKLDYWASKSIAGQVLLEFNCDNDSLARQAFKQVKAKLPVRLHLRMKPKQPKRVLTADELLAMVQEDKERNERLQTQQPNWTQR